MRFLIARTGQRIYLLFKSSDNFQRFSVGAELKTARFDLSTNLYRRIGDTIIDDKKVLQGWDITAKGNIPNYEQVSLGVNTYRFDGVGDTVIKGNKLIAEFRPNPVITVRGEYDRPNGESAKTDISVDFKLAFGKSIQDQLKSTSVFSGTNSVWHKRYDKVERHYDIKTAEAQSAPTLGTAISSTDLAANKISDGDGTTKESAYTLQNSEQYDLADFIGDIPDTLETTGGDIDPNKVTVTAEQVGGDGAEGTDYQFYASDGTTVSLADITASSKFEDIAGGKSATLKLTYSASGFADRIVYVQAIAKGKIGLGLAAADRASNNIKGGDGTTEDTAYTLTNTKSYDLKTFIGTVPDGVTITAKAETISGTNGTDFQFKNGGTNTNVAGVTYSSTLQDMAGAGAAVIKITYSATDFEDRIVYVKTDIAFVANDLKMANLVVPYGSGTVTVSTADILDKLTVTGAQTQKSDWTVKSLAETHGNLAVNGTSLTITGAIGTPTTVTVVFEHNTDIYADQTRTFELSTGTGTIGSATHTGAGKWGKAYTTTYNLKTSDTVGDTTVTFDTSTDFTFEIVAPTNTVSGFTSTTAGIVNGTAMNRTTGAIDGTKLTKSGKLLVKINRVAKGGLPAITEYANFDISKQTAADHPGFTVSTTGITWAMASTAVTYTQANTPAGIGTATYTLISKGTTAGTLAGDGAGKIAVSASNGYIAKTLCAGMVKVQVTYAANDMYEAITKTVDVPISKHTATATLSMGNLVVPYISGTKQVSTATILGQLSVSGGTSVKGDWTLKSLSDKDGIGSNTLGISADKKNLTIKQGIKSGTTVTAVFESGRYKDKTVDFTVSTTTAIAHAIGGKTTLTAKPWGSAIAKADYNLPSSITVNRETHNNLTYTFKVTNSDVGGVKKDDVLPNGVIAANTTTDSGTITVEITRAEITGKVAKATKTVTIPVQKQAGTGSLGMGDLVVAYVSGDKAVSTADITGKLTTVPGGLGVANDWTLKSLSSTLATTTLAIAQDKKSMTIKKAISGGTTLTATFVSDKYTDKTATFTLTTSAITHAIGGKSTLTAKPWGSAIAKADYNLPTSITVNRETHNNLTYTFKVTASTVGGVKKDDVLPNGVIAANTTTDSGTITVEITRAEIAGKVSKATKTVTIPVQKQAGSGALGMGDLTVPYVSGDKDVTASAIEAKLTTVPAGLGVKGDWTLKSLGKKVANTPDDNTLKIDGTKLTIKKAITGTPTLTATFTSDTYTDKTADFKISTSAITHAIGGKSTLTAKPWGSAIAKADYNLPTSITVNGETHNNLTYTFKVTASTVGGVKKDDVLTNGVIAANTTTDSGTITVEITRAEVTGKVAKATKTVTIPVSKQAGTGNLGMTDLTVPYVSGDKDVIASTIKAKLTTVPAGLGVKGDWTLKSLGKKVANTPDDNTLKIDGTKLTIKKAITGTPTLTATFTSDTYTDKTADFKISTSAIAHAITGKSTLTAKPWGSAIAKADYNLPTSITVNGETHNNLTYTFKVTASTVGGVKKDDVLPNGVIAANTTTDSGTITVEITRAEVTGKVAKATKTVTIPVDKQAGSGALGMGDLTVPYVSGDKGVSTGDITGKLTTVPAGLGVKNDWTLKSVKKKVANTPDANTLVIANDGSMTIKKAITGTPTLTATFESDTYTDKTADFKISTSAITHAIGGKSTLTAKPWGSAIAKADYNLPTSITVNRETHNTLTYTFKVTNSTVGGVDKDDVLPNGVIAANTTTDSGTITVEITRAEVTGKVAKATKTVTIPVQKQAGSGALGMGDLTVPYVSGDKDVIASTIEAKLTTVPAGLGVKGDWTLKSLGKKVANTPDDNTLKIDGTKLTIKKAITGTPTLTATFTSDKYTDKTADFKISTSAITHAIGGKSTLTAKPWGSAIAKADYNLPTSITVNRETHNNLTYTFKVTNSDVGGVDKDDVLPNGVIAANTTTDSGTITVEITRAEVTGKVAKATKTVTIPVSKQAGTGNLGMTDLTVPYVSGDKDVIASTIEATLTTVPAGLGVKGDWTLKSLGKKVANTPDDNTLKIDGTKLTIKKAITGTPTLTATFESDTYTDKTADFKISTSAITHAITGKTTLTAKPWGSAIAKADYNLPASITVNRETHNTLTYTFKVTNSDVGGVSKDDVLPNGVIAANTTTDSGTITVEITRAEVTGKVSKATKTVTIPVDKQAGSGALGMGDLVVAYVSGVSGNKPVSTADVLAQLTTVPNSLGVKGDWTLKSVTRKDANKPDASTLVIANDGSMTVKKAITGTPTLTATFTSDKYTDKTAEFKISTQAFPMSKTGATRTGLSGTWGKTFTATNYQLNLKNGGSTNIFDASKDYTFTIVPHTTDDGSGKTKTTAGITKGQLAAAIDSNTGAIKGSELTKSGFLLVKIVRAATGSGASAIPQLTDYQVITVQKQDLSSLTTKPTFTPTTANPKWVNNGGKIGGAFAFTGTGLPSGTTFTDFAWTAAAAQTGGASGTLAVANDGITGATSGGVVVITMKPKAGVNDDKYKGSVDLANFTIAKQAGTGALTLASLVVPYDGTTEDVVADDIKGLLTVPSAGGLGVKADWKLKSLKKKVTNTPDANTLVITGTSMTIKKAITNSPQITATFESDKYTDKTADFTLTTKNILAPIILTDSPTARPWGSAITKADYKLPTSITVNRETFDASKGLSYTFKVTASTVGGVKKDDVLPNGGIAVNTTTDSGTITVEVTRAEISGKVAKATKTVTLTVQKQDLSSLTTKPTFTPTTANPKWVNNGGKIGGTFGSLPSGTTFTDFAWTAAAAQTGGASGTLAVANDGITGATSGGVVVITMKPKAGTNDDKYKGSVDLANFTIAKQTIADHSGFQVTASAIKWDTSSQAVTYTENASKPAGISTSPKYALESHGTTAGTNITVAEADGQIAKTTQSGKVKVKVTYPTNAKYAEIIRYVEVTVDKHDLSSLTTKPTFTPTTANPKWVTGGGKIGGTFAFTGTGLPTGVAATDFAWTVAPKSGGVPTGSLAVANDGSGIIGATSGGTVTLTMKPKAGAKDDKYTGQVILAGFAIAKQTTDDHKSFAVTATGFAWVATSTAAGYSESNAPAGLETPKYALDRQGTTAGTNGAAGAITVAEADGKIANTTQGGKVKVKVTYAANAKYAEIIRYVDVPIAKQNLNTLTNKPTVASTNDKWKASGAKIPLTFSGFPGGTTFGDYTWTAAGKTNAGPDVVRAGLKIVSNNAGQGLTGAISGGDVIITMTATNANKKYTGTLDLAEFKVSKQEKGDISNFGITASAITWNTQPQAVTYTVAGVNAADLGAVSYALESQGTTAGTNGAAGDVAVTADGKIEKTTQSGVVQVKVTYAANPKYKKIEQSVTVTVRKKSSTAINLSMQQIAVAYIRGSKTITTATIEDSLSVTGGSTKGDWTLKSLAKKVANTPDDNTLKIDGKTLIVKNAISGGTPLTATFESNKYDDKDVNFTVLTKTAQMSLGNAQRTSGKWGKTFPTTDYDLDFKNGGSTSIFTNSDYTFSIVAAGITPSDAPSGAQLTTAGITQGTLAAAIDSNTGAIKGSELTKSGYLLVKITRAAKTTPNNIPQLTDYQVITVTKQVYGTDIGTTAPTVTKTGAEDSKWKDNAQTAFNVVYGNLPEGGTIGDYDLTIKGATASGNVSPPQRYLNN